MAIRVFPAVAIAVNGQLRPPFSCEPLDYGAQDPPAAAATAAVAVTTTVVVVVGPTLVLVPKQVGFAVLVACLVDVKRCDRARWQIHSVRAARVGGHHCAQEKGTCQIRSDL